MTGPRGRARLAIVTGASRGIGRAVADGLARDGATVVMLARNAEILSRAASEIGHGAVGMPCDVGDIDAVTRVVERIRSDHGTPDVIVNNAGLFDLQSIERTTVALFMQTLTTNVVAPFALIRPFLAEMRERGSGDIVTLGSIADRVVFPENGAYAASKHALRALHEVLRAELRGTGVRATLVSPGPVNTELWDPIDPDSRPGFTPRASMLSPADVAAAVRYAISQPPTVNVDELRLSHS